MDFSELPIPETVLAGIQTCGFSKCTPIQEITLPLTLAGRDVAGQAQTGTGKTAAFLIAALAHLVNQPRAKQRTNCSMPRALVIAPTRELVAQIEQDAHALNSTTQFHVHCVYGGVDYEKQRRILEEEDVDILIGTPGRLIDYMKQKAYSTKGVEVLVVDEADRMFDMGFIDDLRFMMRRLPPYEERLSMLFSATLSYRAQELSYEYMDMPEVLSTKMDVKTAERVDQELFHVGEDEKIQLLIGLIRRIMKTDGVEVTAETADSDAESDNSAEEPVATEGEEEKFVPHPDDVDTAEAAEAAVKAHEHDYDGGGRTMVFVNTKRSGERIQRWLDANNIPSGYLSGDVPQIKRLKVLKRFQNGELPVLIATDVAGRGLHIDGVTHVVNYDLPENPEDYVHRIGRTARAGQKGDAISLVDEGGAYSLEAVQRYIGMKIPIGWAEDDLFPDLIKPPPRPRKEKRDSRGGRGDGRGGQGRGGQGRSRRSGGGSGGGQGQGGGGNRSQGGQSQASASQAKPQEGGKPTEGDAQKKKRRRRRRRSGSGGGEGGTNGAPAAGSAPKSE
uniref:ATP-dependent RNA helicase rhlB n=1 Tax=Magnetococcus massalia (strain MO-1) TaxID=451514 RepID=A0A1S7LMT9_MAGMO|nr:ATP-dependent RNA helicase rhlB [Candidatus Magnetococcus massalia]